MLNDNTKIENRGRYLKSEAHKQKISMSLCGRKLSEETKKRMSEAKKKNITKIQENISINILPPSLPTNKMLLSELTTLTSNKIGLASEMLVCCDLLKKEFEVYRNIVPNAPFDYMLYSPKKNEYIKIEVGTGHKINGQIKSDKLNIHRE